MSAILENLRNQFPPKATYTIGAASVDVFPDLRMDLSRAIGTLSPGQHVAVDTVIILPDPLFPDWWVWACISSFGTPKYICMRQPVRNLPPRENVFIHAKRSERAFTAFELEQIKEILQDALLRIGFQGEIIYDTSLRD